MSKIKKWMTESRGRTGWVIARFGKTMANHSTTESVQIVDTDDVKEIMFPDYPGVMRDREFLKAMDITYEREDNMGDPMWSDAGWSLMVFEIQMPPPGDRHLLLIDHSGMEARVTEVRDFMDRDLTGTTVKDYPSMLMVLESMNADPNSNFEFVWRKPDGSFYFSWGDMSTEGAVFPIAGYTP